MPKVFISYAHESEAHRVRVLELAQALRRRGVDAWIDRFEAIVPEGWPAWMRRQIEVADRVLLVCTPTYVARFDGPHDASRGVTWEGHVVRQLLYENGGINDKVLPGWFEPTPPPRDLATAKAIPLGDLDVLVDALHGRPEVEPAPLGAADARSEGAGDAPDAAARLDLAYTRRREARRSQLSTAEVDGDIVALERELRGTRSVGPGVNLGRYRLIAEIGDGGFATVWRAFEALEYGEDREVAVKVLHDKWTDAPSYVEQFRKGAARMAGLIHDRVVPVLQPPGPGERFYAMELMPGGSLRDAVLSRRLTALAAVEVALQAAEGLSAAHARGWMHGDVKPHNILLDRRGEGRLADFDLVRIIDQETAQKTRAVGSICYLAPELQDPPHHGDVRADVYGLALVLAFCFQGRDLKIHDVGNPDRFLGKLQISDRLRATLARGLAEEPGARFASVGELVEGVRAPMRPRSPIDLPTVSIPAGSFWMGSPEGVGDHDERPRHRVTITRPFLMGVTPVTEAQWAAVAKAAGLHVDPLRFRGGDRPVEQVSWSDAVKWCNALSAAEGRPLVYLGETVDLAVEGWRLPTEAEWEYACRAGTDTPWSCPDAELEEHAWFGRRMTEPVGQKKPNPWGLYDMHGNVWEWCGDGWRREYTNSPVEDPFLPRASVGRRVIRGGAFGNTAAGCRSAFRNRGRPVGRGGDLGFRVVCPLPRADP